MQTRQRSRLLVSLASALAVALLVTSGSLDAQGRGGFGRGGFGRSMDKTGLIGIDQVRKELGVTEEQAKKVDEVLASYRTASRELFSGFRGRDLSEEERAEQMKKMQESRAKLVAKTEKELDGALSKEQVTRLDQIVLQQQGTDGLVSDRVVASLKLDKETVAKIRAQLTERDEALAALRPNRGRGGRRGGGDGDSAGGGEDTRAKMEELRKKSDTTVLALLSPEQKEAYEGLRGKPFELDRDALRGSGRGPGGGADRGGRRPGGEGGGRRRPGSDDSEI